MPHIVSSGQTWVVSSGQFDSGDSVLLGGLEIVSSGGGASATVISAGGVMSVTAGGTAASTTIAGGTFELSNGGFVGTGAIKFSGTGGTLKFDNASQPA